MSHFAKYLKEKKGIETYESEHGFFTYSLRPLADGSRSVHVHEIYVDDEVRGKDHGRFLWEKIEELIETEGVDIMTCNVDLSSDTARESILFCLKRMSVLPVDLNLQLYKEFNNG